jgi:MoaA/NifB/PqqE/SkfB family radical SAM enzyme
MKIEIADKTLMMIILLEHCNFDCIHCIREDEPMDPGYKLSFEQLRLCLSDCRRLEGVRWVHFTGGEPTLWKEGDRKLIDLLLEISKAGYISGFTTNGSYFLNFGRCRDFFKGYLDNSSTPLRVYFSIDTFHKNFDPETGRAQCLENVTKFMRELPREKSDLLDITVLTVISKDSRSLLPDDMIRHYESSGISFGFVPLQLGGKARPFGHLCPDLDSDNPEDLGAYRQFYKDEDRKKRAETRSRYTANFMNLIGDDYYFYDPWRNVGRLGHLPDSIIQAYCTPEEESC